MTRLLLVSLTLIALCAARSICEYNGGGCIDVRTVTCDFGEPRTKECPGEGYMQCCGGALPSNEVSTFFGACETDPIFDRLTIGAVGDILPHDKNQIEAYRLKSWRPLFEAAIPAMEKVDIMYGNLECNVAGPLTFGGTDMSSSLGDKAIYDGKAYSGYPKFNAHESLLRDLKPHFDVLSTANNHACDRKALGVDRTIENLDKYEIQHTGTTHSSKMANPEWYTIVEKQGSSSTGVKSNWRVAFLSCTFSTNGLTDGADQVLFCYDNGRVHNKVLEIIRELKERQDVDAIVVTPHWGAVEKKLTTSSQERNAARAFLDAGANVVFGTHVHIPQPCENVMGKLVCYSSGNFLSKYSGWQTSLSMFYVVGLRRIGGAGGQVVVDGFEWDAFDQYGPTLRSTKGLRRENAWLDETFGKDRRLKKGEAIDIAEENRDKCPRA